MLTAADRPRRRRRIPRWLWWLAVVPIGLVVLAVAGVMAVLFVSLPLPGDPQGPAVVLDVADVEFAQLTSETSSRDVSLSEVPQHTIDAVVAAEDADFYDHIGVDPRSVLRAIVTNVRNGEISQGGSTITQQYIKVASGNNAQTAWRKLTEAALALKLERTHTKDEILQLYLNSVYFGRGAYGIQAAAQAYYGVDVGQLTVAQSAVLAGLLPAPSIYDPAVDARASHQRYRYVLEQMADNGWLAPEERDALYSQQPPTIPRRTARRDDAPWFTDLVRRELDELGFSDSAGLTIHTTLNLGVQRHAEGAYAEHFGSQPQGESAPAGALVAVDPGSGGILALVGGRDYAQDQFNLALASRQPGSTFKAVALAAWLDAGNSPEDTFPAPGSITLRGADAGSDWTVSNYGGADLGTLSLRRATWRSSNTVYAQITDTLGPEAVATMADRLTGQSDAHPAIASLVLGTHETTPVSLAGLYGTLAAGGQLSTAHTVTEVWDGDQLLYRAPGPGPQVIDETVVADVTDVLQGVVTSGTGQAAAIGRPVAGKTGTTQDYGDAWFAGYTPQVATVVWMGNRDDRSPLPGNETGGGRPAATFATFMAAVHEGLEVMAFPTPANPGPAVEATPTPTTTPTPTPTPTATPTPTPSATATPSPTAVPAPTQPAPTQPGPTPVPSPVPPTGQPSPPIEETSSSEPAAVPSTPEPRASAQPAPTASDSSERGDGRPSS